MRSKIVSRNIFAYAIHVHGKKFKGDYPDLFSRIAQMKNKERIIKRRDLTVAITDIREINDMYFITVVEGEAGLEPLILDLSTGEARIEELEDHELLGAITHVLVKPAGRRVLVEYVKSGAKAEVIASVIEELLVTQFGDDFRVTFAPVVREDFTKEIGKFKRIRVASLTMVKPNAGWDDHYTRISQLLDESQGEKAELEVRAARGESLSKDHGIVELIKEVANDEQPYLADAEIKGIREGENVETSVPLHKHVVSRSVKINREKDGGVNMMRLREKMMEMMSALF